MSDEVYEQMMVRITVLEDENKSLRADNAVMEKTLFEYNGREQQLRAEADDTERRRTDEGRGEYVAHGTFSRMAAEKLKLEHKIARLQTHSEYLIREVRVQGDEIVRLLKVNSELRRRLAGED